MAGDDDAASNGFKEQRVQPPRSESNLSRSGQRGVSGADLSLVIGELRDSDFGIPLTWPLWRKRAARLHRSNTVDSILGLVIMVNMWLIILETDVIAGCRRDNLDTIACEEERYPAWLAAMDLLILGVYTVDVCARIVVDREKILTDSWAMFDLILVIVAFGSNFLHKFPNADLLRLFRLARLGRGMKLIRRIPELYMMVLGLWGCIKTLFWGFLLIVILLAFWAIIAVDFLYPVVVELDFNEGEALLDSYSSVTHAMLTIFQTTITGDSWGAYAIPLINSKPWTMVIFCASFFTIAIGSLNLVTAVVIETASKQPRTVQQQEDLKAKGRLKTICKALDGDKSGCISKDELLRGIDETQELRGLFDRLCENSKELDIIFKFLDSDGSGSVSYDEFAEMLVKLKHSDMQTMLELIKCFVLEAQNDMRREMSALMDLLKKEDDFLAELNHTMEQGEHIREQTAEARIPVCAPGNVEGPKRSNHDFNESAVELLQFLRSQGIQAIIKKEFQSKSSAVPSQANVSIGVGEENFDLGEEGMQEKFDKIFDWIDQDKDGMYDKLLGELQVLFHDVSRA